MMIRGKAYPLEVGQLKQGLFLPKILNILMFAALHNTEITWHLQPL